MDSYFLCPSLTLSPLLVFTFVRYLICLSPISLLLGWTKSPYSLYFNTTCPPLPKQPMVPPPHILLLEKIGFQHGQTAVFPGLRWRPQKLGSKAGTDISLTAIFTSLCWNCTWSFPSTLSWWFPFLCPLFSSQLCHHRFCHHYHLKWRLHIFSPFQHCRVNPFHLLFSV